MGSRVELLVLGTGAGATACYSGECSSSFVLVLDGHPVLLADVGFGVVQRCIAAVGRIPRSIYVSHNHSDHAGELPVLLAVEAAERHGPLHMYSEEGVMCTLREHRLHELKSTGEACNNIYNDMQD